MSRDPWDGVLTQPPANDGLEAHQKKRKTIARVVLAGVALTMTLVWLHLRQRQLDLEAVYAESALLSLAGHQEEALTFFTREATPDVYYRVVLGDAPEGRELAMGCDWIDPEGAVIHQNRYATRPIDRRLWPTHCHFRFSTREPPGRWMVHMSLGDRVVSADSFEMR